MFGAPTNPEIKITDQRYENLLDQNFFRSFLSHEAGKQKPRWITFIDGIPSCNTQPDAYET
mgnify:CR=1 FL=1